MPKHKWHDEIIAWAKGQPIQYRDKSEKYWSDLVARGVPRWDIEDYEFRVKPEPLEFVVIIDRNNQPVEVHNSGVTFPKRSPGHRLVKMREVLDES